MKWRLIGLLWLLVGCGMETVEEQPTLMATLTPLSVIATTSTPFIPDTGWQEVHPGLEQRWIYLLDEQGRAYEQIFLVRVVPALYQFHIAYQPGNPLTLSDWQTQTGALVLLNGGYFTPEWTATGLIITDGVATGVSYADFAGMFAITADGKPELRWLEQQPYDPNEPLQAALQSFPMLVKPGGEMGYPNEDGQPSRRTVIAQDQQGRILFLATNWGSFTLHQLSRFLIESDLEIDLALNLDGGTSTGLLLGMPAEGVGAFVPVPAIIWIKSENGQ